MGTRRRGATGSTLGVVIVIGAFVCAGLAVVGTGAALASLRDPKPLSATPVRATRAGGEPRGHALRATAAPAAGSPAPASQPVYPAATAVAPATRATVPTTAASASPSPRPAPPAPATRSMLPLRLTALMPAPHPDERWSSATIRDLQDGSVRAYFTGDRVRGATIARITPTRVLLRHAGQLEFLDFSDGASGAGPSTAAAAPGASASDRSDVPVMRAHPVGLPLAAQAARAPARR